MTLADVALESMIGKAITLLACMLVALLAIEVGSAPPAVQAWARDASMGIAVRAARAVAGRVRPIVHAVDVALLAMSPNTSLAT